MFFDSATQMLREIPGWIAASLRHRNTITFVLKRSALGDTLMLSALARELKALDPKTRIAVASSYPELFVNNPNFDESRGWHLMRTAYSVQAKYHADDLKQDEHAVRIRWRNLWGELIEKRHPLATGCTAAPLLERVHPEMFLTPEERARGRELFGLGSGPVVLIGCGGKLKPTHNREWGMANFQAIAEALAPHARILQISGEKPLRLNGRDVPDRRGLPVREVAALMAESHATIVQEGGLMHVARAVSAPTVAIFGGFVLPSQTGYDDQINMFSRPECSPCIAGRFNCSHLKCMVPITPRRVMGAIRELFQKQGLALPESVIERLPADWTPPEFVDINVLREELKKGTPLPAGVKDPH